MNIDDALYQIGVHPAIPTYHDHGLSSDTPMVPTYHDHGLSSDTPMFRHIMITAFLPTLQCSDIPFFRHSNVPTSHCSDTPVVFDTLHCSN